MSSSADRPDAWQDIDAAPIAWREAGPDDGELVVLLHGLGGSRVAWNPQLVALAAAGYRCAAWDMPGYGASAPPRDPLTFPSLATAVTALLTTLGSTSAHLVGLSLGGMIAQHVAIDHPGRVRSLTLMDSSPAFGLDGTTIAEAWIEQRLQPLRDGATPASIAEPVLRGIMAPGASSTVVAEGAEAMRRITPDAFAAAVRCVVGHDVRHRLSSIVAPTLVLVGEHDTETPAAYAQFLAATIPGARLETIAGAGHISNLEAPARVNELLIDFLRTVR